MYLYLIYIILLFVVYFEIDRFSYFGKIHKVLFFVILLLFFLLSSLRWERGTDWMSYFQFYNSITSYNPKNWYFEFGYSYLNYLVKLFFNSYTVLLAILAFLVYSLVGSTIYKYGVYPILSLAIWFATSIADIYLTRNTIAISLAIFSIRYIIDRKFIPFLLVIFVAFLFHKSALIFLPAYFIYSLKISRTFLVWGMGGVMVVGLCFSEFIVGHIGGLLGPTIDARLQYYLTTGTEESFGSAYSATIVLLKGTINRSLILIVLLFWMNNERKETPLLNGFINFYVFGLLLFFMTVPLSPALGRIASYYNIFQLFLFPYVLLLGKDRKNQIILFFLIGVYFLIRLEGVITNYEDLYVPYKSIFDIYKTVIIS